MKGILTRGEQEGYLALHRDLHTAAHVAIPQTQTLHGNVVVKTEKNIDVDLVQGSARLSQWCIEKLKPTVVELKWSEGHEASDFDTGHFEEREHKLLQRVVLTSKKAEFPLSD